LINFLESSFILGNLDEKSLQFLNKTMESILNW